MEYQLPTVETIISITPNEHEGIYMKTMQRLAIQHGIKSHS